MEIQADLELKPSPSRIKISGREPLRVLEAIRQGTVGGGESHVLGLVTHLDPDRFRPQVLSFTGGQMVEQFRFMEVPVTVIPSTRAFDPRVYSAVKKLLRSEGIRLVHVHGSRAASNLIFPARSLGIPVIYTIHGWSFHQDQPTPVRMLRILTERWLTGSTRANICVSRANQASGCRHIPNFHCEVIPNGIDLGKFDVGGSHRDIRSQLGIPPGDTLVTYIARITHQKDPLTLIRGFQEVCLRSGDITLLVVGEGDLRVQAEQLAASLNLGSRVIFQGFRLDTPDILKASDIYCLPSLWEGLPIGLLEAMAMGNAVVASRVDGTSEVIRHLENGWLMPPGDAGELATGILTLHRNRELRERIASNAMETVRIHYNIVEMTRKLESTYERVMSRHLGME